jgi:Ca-activated chloride channel family protein
MNLFLMTSTADSLTFGSPDCFWALLLLGPLVWFYIDAARRREALLTRIVAPRLQKQLTGQVSHLKRNLRTGLLLASVVLTVVALAKPRYGYREETITTKGRDVILAIDVSRSMLATDTAPTRLGRAKLISQDLLDLLRGDRVGLIAFAGSAFLQAPLTMDKGAVLTSIRDLDSNTIPKGGTDIASAVRMAIAAFGKGEGATRALVLMTDGEDLEESALDAAKQAEAAGIRIFTIGFGSAAGSLIPIRTDEGRNDFVRDENGNPVNSKLDVSRLTEIAQTTGGFYLPYGQDAAKVIFNKGILPLEEQVGGTLTGRKPIERYAWLVAAALLLLSLRSVLGEGRRIPKVSAASAAMFFLLLAGSPLHASGLNDYQQGNYQGALQDFEKRLKSGESIPEVKFDAGAAAYKAGDFQKAAGYFSEAMTATKPKIRDAATYNLANSLVRAGEAAKEKDAKLSDWKNALQHYETVIKGDPMNARAKENRDIVKKLIEDLKKKQQQKDQNKDQKDQKNDKDNKDQSKSDQSQGGGNGQKDSMEKKDSKDQNDQNKSQDQKGQQGDNKDQQNKDQQKNSDQNDQKPPNDKNDQKGGSQDQKQNQSPQSPQGQGSPTPTPTPTPNQGKGGEGKDQNQKGQNQQDQQSQQPPQSQSGQQGNQQQQSGSQGGQPTLTPSPTPAKQGSLGGGQKGEKKEQQPAEAAEAEESKDGGMTPSQARALLNSVKDEEAHVTEQQKNRAVEQPLRDW